MVQQGVGVIVKRKKKTLLRATKDRKSCESWLPTSWTDTVRKKKKIDNLPQEDIFLNFAKSQSSDGQTLFSFAKIFHFVLFSYFW